MKTDDLDQLRAIAPGRNGAPALFTLEEREALFVSAISGAGDSRPGPARRPVRTWVYRLAPAAAAGTAAAVALVASGGSGGMPAVTGHGHPVAGSHGAEPGQVHTVAYVTRRVRAALAQERSGTLRVTTTYKFGVSREVEDLSTGANRSTFFQGPDGAIREDDSSTGRGRSGIYTVVYYPVRGWWTFKGAFSGPAKEFSVESLRRLLAAGALVIVGDDTVDGQPAIHLRYAGRTFTQHGRKYVEFMVHGRKYLAIAGDIWVSSATFLPIRESNSDSTTDITWSRQPPTPAEVTAVPPAGFTHLDGPPPSLLKTGGGVG